MTRRPVSLALSVNHEEEFPFLADTEALNLLEQLSRHLAHLTRVTEKEVLELLAVRKEGWGERSESLSRPPLVEATNPGAEGAAVPGQQLDPEAPRINRGTLEDCLADTRLVLPWEDVEAYRALVRNLWDTLRPANVLEGFLVADFIQAQWRLDRARRIEEALLERCAFSKNGLWCGLGFGFIHDAQHKQALATLRHYEAGLRKRREKRLALLRRVRKEGWQDALAPQVEVTAATQPEAASAASQPSSGTPGLGPAPDQGSTPATVSTPAPPAGSPLAPGQSSLMSMVRRKIAEANASWNAT